ncbi:TfoX/Sxy family protein [Butyricicoccus faecihominis]|uniref:TfoX/Sxy family protein n=1 Tax=Butyricicoccus faecihominis TaxID=1712515 RepID=UPI00247A8CE5|nr:TfoX/Sxy family protein [Butyricicoccus faecihominis]MCQ5130517.1 TfoX/Sxy family protein [Butyricicoccus faecihominis]
MAQLASMRNIGKEMERKLKAIGIGSAEELIQTGSKEAFLRLKVRFPQVCLVHLYTLQGAIDGIEYNRLTDAVKRDLKRFSDGLIGT